MRLKPIEAALRFAFPRPIARGPYTGLRLVADGKPSGLVAVFAQGTLIQIRRDAARSEA